MYIVYTTVARRCFTIILIFNIFILMSIQPFNIICTDTILKKYINRVFKNFYSTSFLYNMRCRIETAVVYSNLLVPKIYRMTDAANAAKPVQQYPFYT